MIPAHDRGSRRTGTLLLADISGYTSFLNGVAEAHRAIILEADEPPAAYALISTLLDAVVATVSPGFRLAKLEGDALFAVADDRDVARGEALLAVLRACHAEFARLLGRAGERWTCRCEACARIGALGLKFVLHHGDYVEQRIVGREEVAGPDVILVHRLLKNHARDLVGDRPYALLTDATLAALDVPADAMIAGTEAYDGQPSIAVHVLPLA
jgi:hypothetical protein